MIPLDKVKMAIVSIPRTQEYLTHTVADMMFQDHAARDCTLGIFSDSLSAPAPCPSDQEGWLSWQAQCSILGSVAPPWPEPLRMSWPTCVKHIEASPPARLARIQYRNLRVTPNLIRALRWWASEFPYTMVFEDDIAFTRDWLKRALSIGEWLDGYCHGESRTAALLAGQSFKPTPWVLTLMHFWDNEGHFDQVGEVGDDAVMRWNQQGPLWGSQAYLMPTPVALQIADKLEYNCGIGDYNQRLYAIGDEGIWRMCSQLRMFDFYAPNPCFVQHIGGTSSLFADASLSDGRTCKHFDTQNRRPPPLPEEL